MGNSITHHWWQILVITALVGGVCLLSYAHTLEDSYITYRYAEHLAEGYPLGAWNTNGELVEGYTTTLWMLLLAGAASVGLSVITVSKLVGMAALLMLALVWLLPHPRTIALLESPYVSADDSRRILRLTGLLYIAYLPIGFYATSGMETLPTILLISLLLLTPFERLTLWMPILSMLLVIMRPEGIVLVGAIVTLHGLRAWQARQSLRPFAITVGLAIGIYSALALWRLSYYGMFFPNTYYAKSADGSTRHLWLGMVYVMRWAFYHPIVALVLSAVAVHLLYGLWGGVRRQTAAGWLPYVLLGASGGYVLYIVRAGGDAWTAFPYFRHFVHLSPLLFLLFNYGLVRLIRAKRVRYGVVVINLVVMNLGAISSPSGEPTWLPDAHTPLLRHRPPSAYLLWLKERADADTVVASALGGQIPYYVDAIHIDTLGLNNEYIAHHGRFDPNGPPDSKTDMAYVLQRQPDILTLPIRGTELRDGTWVLTPNGFRNMMIEDTLATPLFFENYCFASNAPYVGGVWDRAVFVHTRHLSHLTESEQAACIPVRDTILYAAD